MVRSILFVPGDRPDRAAKSLRAGADAVALDLEDAVAASSKDEARAGVAAIAASLAEAGQTVLLRVNAVQSEWFLDDARLLPLPGVDAVIVPKLDRASDVATVARVADGVPIVAGLETVRGVADAREVLVGPVVACYFGAEDYTVDLGGARTEHNAEVAVPRALVAIAARVAGVSAFDQTVLFYRDSERFDREAVEARALGYSGKICIHPAQVPIANERFVPSAEEIDRAERLLLTYDTALAAGQATCAFEGEMVDEVVARQARSVLAAAGRR